MLTRLDIQGNRYMSNGVGRSEARIKNWQIFSGLVVINLLIIWFAKEYIFRYDFLYHLFQEQMEISRLEHQLDLLHSWFDLNYFLVPISLFLKFNFISFILQLPLLFILDDVAYAKIFRVVMIAHLAILASSVMQCTLLFSKPVDSIEIASLSRMPLSLAGLTNQYSNLSNPAKMVMARFNVFELLWCSIIYYKIKTLTIMKHVDIFILVAGVWMFLLIIQWISAEILMLLSI